MHVPDSAVSPATSALFGAAMVPVWAAAGRRLRTTLATRRVPLLALGAAYSFTLMMFNLPVPGGTTAHTTGAVLLAIVLGPWAACIAVTVTLAIQALFFADGGLLALGVNAFAMAFAMPFAGYAAYRAVAAGSAPGAGRRAVAAGVGAWVGLVAAALVVGLALGVQPLLHRGADGRALYFPFGPGITLPAMLLPHLTVAGAAEALFTVAALRALQAAGVALDGGRSPAARPARLEWLLAGLGALLALTPLGLVASAPAWGEWSLGDLAARAGYLPRALAAAEAHAPRAPLADYLAHRGALAYALAGLLGAVVVGAIALGLGRALARRATPLPPGPPAPRAPVAPGQLPAWLRAPAPPAGEPSGGPRARRDLTGRTLVALAGGVHRLIATDELARRNGLLQRLDARVKIVTLVACVVLVYLQRAIAPVLVLLGLAALLAALSRVPLGLLFGRFGAAVGAVAAVITLPAALDVVTPGAPLVALWREPPLALTAPGLAFVALFALRVIAAAVLGALLALTTPWSELLAGLRALGAPRLFLDVLAMTWRYFAVLLRSATEMFAARRSRTVGTAAAHVERRFLGGGAAALLGRSLAFAEEVHAAMRARGWDGEARALPRRPAGALDLAWVAAIGALIAAIALWPRLGGPPW